MTCVLAGSPLISTRVNAVPSSSTPTTVARPLIPPNTEEFTASDWIVDPVSPILDESIRTARGVEWRVQRRGSATEVSNAKDSISIDGDWALGIVTARGHRSGASADGTTLVLANARSRDRFAVVRAGKVALLKFSGTFAIDAVSNDGRLLYLIETTDAENATYAVRKADLVTGKLIAGAVENIDVDATGRVIKEDGDPKMRGKPLDRTPGPDGWIYTLYYSDSHPYVHALDSAGGGPGLCFDLPNQWNAKAESLRLVVPGDTMTVESSGRPLARLLGTRVGTQPKIELIAKPSSHNRTKRR